jgi:hypothetical protein
VSDLRKFDLNTLFSTQCLARWQVGRDLGLACGRTLQKWLKFCRAERNTSGFLRLQSRQLLFKRGVFSLNMRNRLSLHAMTLFLGLLNAAFSLGQGAEPLFLEKEIALQG